MGKQTKDVEEKELGGGQPPAERKLFPLAPERLTATLRVRGEEVTYCFEPITVDDWIELEKLSSVVTWTDGEGLIRSESMEAEAFAQLCDRRVIDLIGVEGRACDTPLRHKMAAITLLCQAAPAGRDERSDTVTVTIEAARNGERYPQLEHVFKRPQMSDELELERVRARASAVKFDGDVRKSVRLSILPELIALYDRLIVGVDGYDLGEAKTPAEAMDPIHKKVAVLELFASGLE